MCFLQGVYYFGLHQIPETDPPILWAAHNLCIAATQATVHFVVFVYMTSESK